MSEALLRDIAEFCRQAGMAESTFGRRAVNDGKLVSRLRLGGRVTTETADRVHAFIAAKPQSEGTNLPVASPVVAPPVAERAARNFRFYDNRQKYLLFVTTCGEKWAVAQRVSMELGNIHPRPPALRLFDAGTGDGTVLTRTMRAMHHRFPTMPFYIVAKEISLEDVRLTLEKMPDRLFEHPATVLVMTNMYYAEAPWLTPHSVTAATSLVWHDLSLAGNTAHDFEEQIGDLQEFLGKNWQARVSARSGNPVYEKPVVLVIYREDHKFLLDQVRPRRLGDVEDCIQIDGAHLLPPFVGKLRDRRHELDTGVVHHVIDRAEIAGDRCDHCIDGARVGDVTGVAARVDARLCGDLARGRDRGFGSHVAHRDARTGLG